MQDDKTKEMKKTSWWAQYILPIAVVATMVLPSIAQAKGKKSGKNYIDGPNGKIEVFAEENVRQDSTLGKDVTPKKKKWPTVKEMRNGPACKPLSEVKESLKSDIPAYEAWLMANGYSPTEGKFGWSYIDFSSTMENRAEFNKWISYAYTVPRGSPLISIYVFLPDKEHYVQTGEWRADPKELDRYVAPLVVGPNAKKAQDALREFMTASHTKKITPNHSVRKWQKVSRIVAKGADDVVDEEMLDNMMAMYPVGCAMRDLARQTGQQNLVNLFKSACDYICQNPQYAGGVCWNLYSMLNGAQMSRNWGGDDWITAIDAYASLGGAGRRGGELLGVANTAKWDRIAYLREHPELKKQQMPVNATGRNPAGNGNLVKEPLKPTYGDKPAKNLSQKTGAGLSLELEEEKDENGNDFEYDEKELFDQFLPKFLQNHPDDKNTGSKSPRR